MIYYVDTKYGNDVTGFGDPSRPFLTLARAVALLQHGDEIIVNDVLIDDHDDYFFVEPSTIELIGLINVSIRFLKTPGQNHTATVWKVGQVSDKKANLYIENCSGIKIDGPTFMSQSPLTDHRYAVRVVNSSDIAISDCKIHRDWEVDDSTPHGELISLHGSNAVVSSCFTDGLNNSYSNELHFISVSGAGDYELYGNRVENLTSNNGLFHGIHVSPDTRKVTVDGFVCHNAESDLVDKAVGIYIESDTSQVEFLVNAGQFSRTHVGVHLKNIPVGSGVSRRIKHCTFYHCRVPVLADKANAEVYSCSIHTTRTVSHEYPPGHTLEYTTYGIFAKNHSNIHSLNTIFTGCDTVFHAEVHSMIDAGYLVWHNCSRLSNEVQSSTIRAVQYVRRVDPLYEDLTKSIYGSFVLQGSSVAIDAGKKYGDLFLGLAPDIGALERGRDIRIDDLPALISRTVRYSTKVPITNIDIEGMIVQGLDTYDPEIQAGREGSAVKDIAVKPLIGLLSPYTTELEYIRDGLSFARLETLSEDAADLLAANVFVSRLTGDIASGVVRLYFAEPSVAIIPAEAEFRSSNAQIYYCRQEVQITAEEMGLNFEDGLYYVDVAVEAAEQGEEYNVEAGAITSSSTPLPSGVTAIANPAPIEGGATSENNYELKDRIETAITVRDLVTKKGIVYVTQDLYKFIREVRPIGYRDPEMLRDEILGYHIGGKVDIYVKTAALYTETAIIEEWTGSIPLTLNGFGNVPVVSVEKVEVLDPLTLDTTDIEIPKNMWEVRVHNPKTTMSIYEDKELWIHPDYNAVPVQITYKWASEIKLLQDWVEDSDHRVVCADLYVKHFLPTFVTFSISYYAAEEIENLQTLLEIYVEDLKSTKALQHSDLVDYMYRLGATHVVEPFTLRGEFHGTDGSIVVSESEDQIVTERTSRFFVGNISVQYLGVDQNDM